MYFYTDENGQQQGPIDDSTLRILVAQKTITPQTPLETESGHRGLAGQIPGLFPVPAVPSASPSVQGISGVNMPAPSAAGAGRQAFCTNCGNAVAEKAVACMSCGSKPFGHKRFCRSCGVGLNPGQVVCTQCGAALTGGGMPDLSKISGALTSANTKKYLIPAAIGVGAILALLLVWFVVLPLLPGIGGSGNPLRSAKAGDYARYSVKGVSENKDIDRTNTNTTNFRTEVISNRGGKAKLKITGPGIKESLLPPVPGLVNDKGEIEITIALKKSPVETFMTFLESNLSELHRLFPDNPIKKLVKIQKGKNSTETLDDVGGKSIKCAVKTWTITTTDPDSDDKFTTTIKEWTSSKARGALLVKMEIKTKGDRRTDTMTVSLTDFGNDK